MVLVLWGFSMALVWCPAKSGSGRRMSMIFSKIKWHFWHCIRTLWHSHRGTKNIYGSTTAINWATNRKD